jgi:hypothetical protein
MALLNAKQEELYTIYEGIQVRGLYNPYTDRFTEANPAFLSDTTKIHIEDMLAEMYEAESFDRDSAIPAVQIHGHTRVSIEPVMLGGKMGLSALDTLNKSVGQPIVMIGGKVVDNSVYTKTSKLEVLKSGVEQGKANMGAEMFLTSQITELGLNVDPTGESEKGDVTVTPANNEKVATTLVRMIRTFFKNKGYAPKIAVGDAVVDALIAEIDVNTGKATKGDYTMTQNGDQGFNVSVDTMNIPIEVLAPVNAYKGNEIDTTDRIILWAPHCLGLAYAVLEGVDGAGNPMAFKSQYITDEGEVNRETGRGSVYVKSAPLPLVLNNTLIERWNLVVA